MTFSVKDLIAFTKTTSTESSTGAGVTSSGNSLLDVAGAGNGSNPSAIKAPSIVEFTLSIYKFGLSKKNFFPVDQLGNSKDIDELKSFISI